MKRPLHKIIEEQINRWERGKIKPDPVMKNVTVITISREAGSRGREVAEKLAQNTGFDLFHNEIVESMIETSKNSRRLLETLDERGMNIVEDIVSAWSTNTISGPTNTPNCCSEY